MPKVWLIRHGQSEANAGLRSASASAIPLTALGRTQAEAVSRRFAGAPGRIAFSTYVRAAQTSEPTRARFPAVAAAPWPVHEFTYLAPERCRDTTSAERAPLVQAYWDRGDPDHIDGAGVESFRGFLGRVDAALARMHADGAPLLAIFTHGQFMQAAMWRVTAGQGPGAAGQMAAFRAFMLATPIPNAAVLELELSGGAARLGPLATDHLATLDLTY